MAVPEAGVGQTRFPGPLELAILGSGKLAWDIGSQFMEAGHRVSWFCTSRWAPPLEGKIQRLVRRLERNGQTVPEARVLDYRHFSPLAPGLDLLLEASREDLATKQELGGLASLCRPDCLRLGNSSSFPPEVLGPGWLGAHFFYPLKLHPLVELILPPDTSLGDQSVVTRARDLLQALGFHCLVQKGPGIFTVNRLVLPTQARALEALAAGLPASMVDQASRNPWHPAGILATLDSVGFATVAQAAENYSRLDPDRAKDCQALAQGCLALTDAGISGAAYGQSLFDPGLSLPWSSRTAPPLAPGDGESLAQSLVQTLAREAARFVELGWVSLADLDLILEEVYGAGSRAQGLLAMDRHRTPDKEFTP